MNVHDRYRWTCIKVYKLSRTISRPAVLTTAVLGRLYELFRCHSFNVTNTLLLEEKMPTHIKHGEQGA